MPPSTELCRHKAAASKLAGPCGRTNSCLTWREHGGPPINGEPENEGFGSLLARLTVMGQLGGNICYDWNQEGLTVKLSAPLEHLMN